MSDTSKEYIAMCDCPEIQGLWVEPHWGDFIAYDHDEQSDSYQVHATISVVNCYKYKDVYIWLPRQDQLQGMIFKFLLDKKIIGWEKYPLKRLHKKFYDFCDELDWVSMEQLWLAFVMKEKFGKTWSGSEWKTI